MNSKSHLRKICLKKREIENKKFGSDCIDSEIFLKLITEIKLKQEVSTIGIYYPINSEISPLKIKNFSKNFSFETCLPIMDKINGMLIFEKYEEHDKLLKNNYGVFEPVKRNEVIPEVIFVPMVGFDKKLNRLGYGKGYYDKTISKLRKTKKLFVIGLAYDNQKLDHIPVEDHDKKMDLVLTEKNIYN